MTAPRLTPLSFPIQNTTKQRPLYRLLLRWNHRPYDLVVELFDSTEFIDDRPSVFQVHTPGAPDTRTESQLPLRRSKAQTSGCAPLRFYTMDSHTLRRLRTGETPWRKVHIQYGAPIRGSRSLQMPKLPFATGRGFAPSLPN